MNHRPKKPPRKGRFIDISEDWKLTYWSARLRVPGPRLRRAVERVGTRADDVVRELSTTSRR
jgi:hypothetical protein